MKFNLWFVLLLALMPVFILFTGLSAAGGFESAIVWEIIGIVVVAGLGVGYLARLRSDEDPTVAPEERTEKKAAPVEVATTTMPEVRTFYSAPCFLHDLDDLEVEEILPDELPGAERLLARDLKEMRQVAQERVGAARTTGPRAASQAWPADPASVPAFRDPPVQHARHEIGRPALDLVRLDCGDTQD